MMLFSLIAISLLIGDCGSVMRGVTYIVHLNALYNSFSGIA